MARNLGFKRASEARAAFLRALRSQPDEARQAIKVREHERLDALEARIRDRDADQPEKLERRLQAVTNLRALD